MFSIKPYSISAFSGDLSLKKNKIDSTETITMKTLKKLNILATVPNLSIRVFDSLSPKTITSVTCSKGNWKNNSNLKLSPLSSG